jgi:hypothetical protein
LIGNNNNLIFRPQLQKETHSLYQINNNIIIMMTDSNESVIRYVVALNNIGVSLLDRKCYDQALNTLQDAMPLIHQIVHASEVRTSSRKGASSPCCCSVLHHNALQRLIHARPAQSQEGDRMFKLNVVELFSNHAIIDSIIHEAPTTREEEYDNPRFYRTCHPIRLEGYYNDALEHHSQYDVIIRNLDDRKTRNPMVFTHPMNDNDDQGQK